MIPAPSSATLPNTHARHVAPSVGMNAASMILSLEKNPANGGMPRIASQPIMKVTQVIFM